MAVTKKKNGKENLNWKINYLAAKIGEDTHISNAKKAALNKNDTTAEVSEQDLKQELNNMKKRKLETKLHHIQKEIKTCLKKSKAMETKKHIKKLREAKKEGSITNEENEKDSSTEKKGSDKKTKEYTAKEVDQLEKEYTILKTIDMEKLTKKILEKYIQKNATLKQDDTLKSILSTTTTTTAAAATAVAKKEKEDEKEKEGEDEKEDDQKTYRSNVEARLLSNKLLVDTLKINITELELIVLGPSQKKAAIESKRKAETQKTTTAPKKIKTKETSDGSSSLFMETLADENDEDEEQNDSDKDNHAQKEDIIKTKLKPTNKKISDDWEDPDFDKYYNGTDKKNRPGQRQRRQKWLALYGDEAKHVKEEKTKKHQRPKQQRDQKQQKSAPSHSKGKNQQSQNVDEFHPSWQAKRQQQELMAKALSGNNNKNNKIVFDDAD
ncbi:hypothetical protein BJ944DRAFT_270193 [Cunninghamella echinulata]|nr:hypothetical protein BJ944DRAFT_270193 [Cunninghamella echinulata]